MINRENLEEGFLIRLALSVFVMGLSIIALTIIYKNSGGIQKGIKVDLTSVVINNDVEGSFTLGTGSIDTTSYYYVYEEDKNNSKQLAKYNSEKTKIFETLEVNENPYVTYDLFLGTKTNINMFVPKNTITKKINIDLENL